MLSSGKSISAIEHTHPTVISLQNAAVFYKEFCAIESVSLDVRRGEILAIVGEHRAGKTTLAKTLAGLLKPDKGQLTVFGGQYFLYGKEGANQPRIEMIHQGLQIFPTLTILENIFIQSPIPVRTTTTLRKMVDQAKSALNEVGLNIPMDTKVEDLTIDQKIYVDIARAICRQPDVLIVDELDKKLPPEKLEVVYEVLFRLRDQGVAIVYVSNNFDEIFSFANRICILKDGRIVETEEVQDLDKIKLINMTYSFVLSREELTQENKELYFQQKYNQTIIENLGNGVVILDSENQLYSMNQAALVWFNSNYDAAKGLPAKYWLSYFELSEQTEILDAVERRHRSSWKAVERGNEVFQVELVPFRDEIHKHLGIILTIENVTEQRDFEDYLIRTEKIASVSELASGIAHEINNPLSIISNYLEIICDDSSKVRIQENVLKIQRQLKRINDVMGSMLGFSKISSGSGEPIEITDLVKDVIDLMNHHLDKPGIQLSVQFPDKSVNAMVRGNATLLSQVLVNIIQNAIEAIDQHGELDVTLKIREEDDIVDLVVSDSGPGLAEGIEGKLFSPFFSTKSAKKNSGLGLAICQHIIDSHNGLIFVNRDHMTRFHIRLPLYRQ